MSREGIGFEDDSSKIHSSFGRVSELADARSRLDPAISGSLIGSFTCSALRLTTSNIACKEVLDETIVTITANVHDPAHLRLRPASVDAESDCQPQWVI